MFDPTPDKGPPEAGDNSQNALQCAAMRKLFDQNENGHKKADKFQDRKRRTDKHLSHGLPFLFLFSPQMVYSIDYKLELFEKT
jgi:hypothetical protein